MPCAVHDSGPGIPAEHLPCLFERFYRVEKSRSRHFGGVGLGLSLAKHFVALHGGSITVRSGEGRGTTFAVMLPAARVVSSGLAGMRVRAWRTQAFSSGVIRP